jgi:hypothetical protein
MLLKPADDKSEQINLLVSLSKASNISNVSRDRIYDELSMLRAGIKGEQDSAYEIDFYFGKSKNWMVVHDLRLGCDGRVAQIDHLLISRFLVCYVIETKNYSASIEISEKGEFTRIDDTRSFGIASPIEQNNKHIEVIRSVFEKLADKLPKRIGIKLMPEFRNVVLFSKTAQIKRPIKFDTRAVMKAEQFKSWIDEEMNNPNPSTRDFIQVAKVVSSETITDLGLRLVARHKPIMPDYNSKFCLAESGLSMQQESRTYEVVSTPQTNDKIPDKNYWCASCKAKITERVAKFCWDNKQRFAGRAYCINCQKAH